MTKSTLNILLKNTLRIIPGLVMILWATGVTATYELPWGPWKQYPATPIEFRVSCQIGFSGNEWSIQFRNPSNETLYFDYQVTGGERPGENLWNGRHLNPGKETTEVEIGSKVPCQPGKSIRVWLKNIHKPYPAPYRERL